MRAEITETEDQRRRRVSSRIRNELLGPVVDQLIELARNRKMPDEWMTAERINELLERRGVWRSHPDVMATFLSPSACEETVARALDVLTTTHSDLWVRVGHQYKPAGRDWSTYAAHKANRIRREYPTEERTAFHSGAEGASILFAHDDYETDPRARHEVSLLRKFLEENGIPELGFGLSTDRQTWVMVVWSQDEIALNRALFNAWQTAFGTLEELKF